jgi:hypothetical protein
MSEQGGRLGGASPLKAAPADGVGPHTGLLAVGEGDSKYQRRRWEQVEGRRVRRLRLQEGD